jgi:hypothetical protein
MMVFQLRLMYTGGVGIRHFSPACAQHSDLHVILVAMLVVLPESWWELDSDAERTRRCAGEPLSRLEHACVVNLMNCPEKTSSGPNTFLFAP